MADRAPRGRSALGEAQLLDAMGAPLIVPLKADPPGDRHRALGAAHCRRGGLAGRRLRHGHLPVEQGEGPGLRPAPGFASDLTPLEDRTVRQQQVDALQVFKDRGLVPAAACADADSPRGLSGEVAQGEDQPIAVGHRAQRSRAAAARRHTRARGG